MQTIALVTLLCPAGIENDIIVARGDWTVGTRAAISAEIARERQLDRENPDTLLAIGDPRDKARHKEPALKDGTCRDGRRLSWESAADALTCVWRAQQDGS
ncbi:MAG: hypothetical protein AAGD13_02550 [Pseudomonadota bacterium]